MAFVLLPCDLPTWPTIQRHLRSLSGTKSASQVAQVLYTLHSLCNVSLDPETPEVLPPDLFNGLEKFLNSEAGDDFFSVILPFMIEAALNLKTLLPSEGLVYSIQQEDAERILDRHLVSSLLAHIFFCTLPRRTQLSHPTLTDPRIAPVLCSLHRQSQQVKTKALLQYFRVVALNKPEGKLKFSRKVMTAQMFLPMGSWSSCDLELCPVQIRRESSMQLYTTSALLTCFTSPDLARPALGTSNSQQVTTMISYPELLVSSVIAERLEDNEALQVTGALHTSTITNLTSSPCFRPLMNVIPPDLVHVLMDADDYKESSILQYEKINVLRELNKAWVGFTQPPPLSPSDSNQHMQQLNLDEFDDIISVSRQNSNNASANRLIGQISSDSENHVKEASKSDHKISRRNKKSDKISKSKKSNSCEQHKSNALQEPSSLASPSNVIPAGPETNKHIKDRLSALKKESSQTESEKDLPFCLPVTESCDQQTQDFNFQPKTKSPSEDNAQEIVVDGQQVQAKINSVSLTKPSIQPKNNLLGIVSTLQKNSKQKEALPITTTDVQKPVNNSPDSDTNSKPLKVIEQESSNEVTTSNNKNKAMKSCLKNNIVDKSKKSKTQNSASVQKDVEATSSIQKIEGLTTEPQTSLNKTSTTKEDRKSCSPTQVENKSICSPTQKKNRTSCSPIQKDGRTSSSPSQRQKKSSSSPTLKENKKSNSQKDNNNSNDNLEVKGTTNNPSKPATASTLAADINSLLTAEICTIESNEDHAESMQSQETKFSNQISSNSEDVGYAKTDRNKKERENSATFARPDNSCLYNNNIESCCNKTDRSDLCSECDVLCDNLNVIKSSDLSKENKTENIKLKLKPNLSECDHFQSVESCTNCVNTTLNNKIINSSVDSHHENDKEKEKLKKRVNTLEHPMPRTPLDEDDETTKLLNRILKAIEKLEAERPELVKRKHSGDYIVHSKLPVASGEVNLSPDSDDTPHPQPVVTSDEKRLSTENVVHPPQAVICTSCKQLKSPDQVYQPNAANKEEKDKIPNEDPSVRPKTKSKPPLPEIRKPPSFSSEQDQNHGAIMRSQERCRYPPGRKRLSMHRKSSDHKSVESIPEEEVYFSACESLDGHEGREVECSNSEIMRRKSASKDKGRRKSFADRLKETLAHGTSNDNSLSRPVTPDPDDRQQSEDPVVTKDSCTRLTVHQNVVAHRQVMSRGSSSDPLARSRGSHDRRDTQESFDDEDKDSASSRYSFSSDYSSDMEGVYDQLEEILDNVEGDCHGPRSAAVAKFAHGVLKRALSDTYKGLSVGLDGNVIHKELPCLSSPACSSSEQSPRQVLSVRSHTHTGSMLPKQPTSPSQQLQPPHVSSSSASQSPSAAFPSFKSKLTALELLSPEPYQDSIFSYQESHLKPVVTGNWGCGSLKGDPELKAMIQWAAASRAGAPVVIYYTAGDASLIKLDLICRMISDRHWTVGQLVTSLMAHCQARIQEWQQNEVKKVADTTTDSSFPDSYKYRIPSLDGFTLFDELIGTVARSTHVLQTEL